MRIVDEDLIGTRPIKAMVLKYWMKIIRAFCNGPILIGKEKCFHRKQDEYRLIVTNIEDKNSLNNEEREIV